MMNVLTIPAKEVRAGDQIKTDDGFIAVGGVQPLSGKRVGLFTRQGMVGVDAEAMVTVRREVD
jgi:hypothetical protein